MIGNLLSWSAQVLLVVTVAAAASPALKDARARLYFWQGILVVILLLPAAVLSQRPAPRAAIAISIPRSPAATEPSVEAPPSIFSAQYLIVLLAAGTALRFAWLTIGLFRLRRFRRQAVRLHPPPVAFAGDVRWYLSDSVSGPVTYGWPRASILLPARFPDMPAGVQEAIASHELMHVHRNDWLFVMAEEIVRGLLWFHPAVWFVLSRIQLAREQVVDREVVQATNDRIGYLDALMAVAAQKLRPDVAPAPLFLKKRQLAVRVAAILKETSMSGSRLIACVSAATSAAVFGVCAALWLFPLEIPAQIMPDDGGITVDAGALLLHRPPLRSPGANVTGDVIVEATLDPKGEVTDARVLSGPEEARKAVLASVLGWHYSSVTLPPDRVRIVVHFGGAPATLMTPLPTGPTAPPATFGMFRPAPATVNSLPARVNAITFTGLSPELVTQIESQIRLRAGDTLDALRFEYLLAALNHIDEHLSPGMTLAGSPTAEPAVNLNISLLGAVAGNPAPLPVKAYTGSTPVQVPFRTMGHLLVAKVPPAYPDLAKRARIQGAVTYDVIIGPDGTIQNMQLNSGDPMLATPEVAAAVSRWRYQPYISDGAPAPVQTQVIVNFVLN